MGRATYDPGVAEALDPHRQRHLLDAVLVVASELELPAVLQRIIETAVDLVDARYGALGVLDETGTRLAEFLTVGVDDEQRRRIGDPPEGHGILGHLIVDATPLRLPDLTAHPDSYGFPPGHPEMRSFLGVPLRVRDVVFGNLYLADKRSADAFTELDEELVVGLAGAAGVAIENARLTKRVRDLALAEDRERIARDLHDSVIQRLFATGMSLQSTQRLVSADPPAATARIVQAVDDLDVTIRDIRTAIFGLEQRRPTNTGLRAALVATVREAAGALGFEPRLTLDGPIDTVVPAPIGADVLAVVREGLSNVARHARASEVTVEIAAGRDVMVRVIDNGIGVGETPAAGNGLRNLQRRATRRHGDSLVSRRPQGGTCLEWRAPLTAP
ncbi:MAG: GAF domain-containing protein [Desertimonas sp.]